LDFMRAVVHVTVTVINCVPFGHFVYFWTTHSRRHHFDYNGNCVCASVVELYN